MAVVQAGCDTMADRAGRSEPSALLYFRAVRQDGEVTPACESRTTRGWGR
jgi:hypothetical protein